MLFDGALTFTYYDDDPEELYCQSEEFPLEAEPVEGATVEVTIGSTTYTGVWAVEGGWYSANFIDGDDYLGGIGGEDTSFAITIVGDGVTGEKAVVVTQS